MSRELSFYAAVHSIATGREENLATFYIMNTSRNMNRWGVTEKALEEALTTLLGKSLGCGPGHVIDRHYDDPVETGRFIGTEKPDGYALGTANITDLEAWERVCSGEWGPISVVIRSFREVCSVCGEVLPREEDPFTHECIAEGDGYVLVESFVFHRVDFVEAPAYPQAGLINLADAGEAVPLELLAGYYVSQSNLDGSQGSQGRDPKTLEQERKKMDEMEDLRGEVKKLKAELEKLQEENTALREENTGLKAEKDRLEEDVEDIKNSLEAIRKERHQEKVNLTLEARTEAGLVKDREAEHERLSSLDDSTLEILREDALKVAEKLSKNQGNGPKAKNTGADVGELEAAIEEERVRLFGYRKEATN